MSSSYGRAVLRMGVEDGALQAYQRFSSSGITPAMFASGEFDGVNWLLVEWIDGTSLTAELTSAASPIDWLRATTNEVLRTVRKLHTVQAPVEEHRSAVEHARKRELFIVTSMKVPDTPQLTQTAQNLWTPAVALHGDLLANNVLRQDDGSLRFIDPAGGYGPAEADAGFWVAQACSLMRSLDVSSYDEIFGLAVEYVEQVAASAPWLTGGGYLTGPPLRSASSRCRNSAMAPSVSRTADSWSSEANSKSAAKRWLVPLRRLGATLRALVTQELNIRSAVDSIGHRENATRHTDKLLKTAREYVVLGAHLRSRLEWKMEVYRSEPPMKCDARSRWYRTLVFDCLL